MDLKALLAQKLAAKNNPVVAPLPVINEPAANEPAANDVVESDAEDSIMDSDILNSMNGDPDDNADYFLTQGTEFDAAAGEDSDEDDGEAYDAMQTRIAENYYEAANPTSAALVEEAKHIAYNEQAERIQGEIEATETSKAAMLLAIMNMPKEDVPEPLPPVVESFVAQKPMTFAERVALNKAKLTGTPVVLRAVPSISQATKDAQDKLHAIAADQAARRKQVEAEAKEQAAELAFIADQMKKAKTSAEVAQKAAAVRFQEAEAEKLAVYNKNKELAAEAAKLRASLVPAMKAEIAKTIGKMSFADKMAMRKAGQEAAKEAVEEMDLMAEPPEELSTALTGEISDEAVAKAYQDEMVDLDNGVDATNESFSLNITLNARQLVAKEFALAGKNFALIGAAGTGKTTTQRSVAETLVEDSRLHTTSYKVVGGMPGARVDAPSIAFVAYTRRASANLARAIHKSPALAETLKHNIMTIHALLEFEPETFWNDEKNKEDFRFIPRRNSTNPLTITHLVIEEASMLGLDLWENLFDALPHGVQIIFIGDINQLPPVFGASILNYALVQLPIVELTEVYRNAGIVLASAHNVLKGEPLIEGESQDDDGNMTGKVTIVRGKSPVQVGQGKMAMSLGKMFKLWYEMGYYDPEDCMILSPWNKKDLGTDNMNSWIAQFLGAKRDAVVWEVVSGFNKLYLAVGDKVMYNKQDAIITEIKFNGMYHGKEPQPPGTDLGRFGVRILGDTHIQQEDIDDQLLTYSNFSVDELEETAMERKQQASHVVVIKTETGQIMSLSAAGDFGPQVFSLGYVLTVHKAQGCEWKKVFIILHKDHAVSLTRELFYTALTRARMEAIVIAKDTVIAQAIKTQRIKGNTLQDKIEYFNSGAMDIGAVSCVK